MFNTLIKNVFSSTGDIYKAGISFESVIKQRLSRQVFRKIKASKAASKNIALAFPEIAESLNILQEELAQEISLRLGLEYCPKLHLPSLTLITACGYSQETLENYLIAPQHHPYGVKNYKLVVANPDQLAISEFLDRGVIIELGLAESIQNTWKEFSTYQNRLRSPSVSSQKIVACEKTYTENKFEAAIIELVEAAENLGAKEMFLGHPEANYYQFTTGERTYIGSLSKELTSFLGLQLSNRNYFSIKNNSLLIECKSTKNAASDLIYFNWTRAREAHQVNGAAIKESIHISGILSNPLDASFEAISTEHEHSKAQTTTIALIDDDERFSRLLKTLLEEQNFIVTTFSNPNLALSTLSEKDDVNLIICDMHMPTLDGVSFTKKFREKQRRIPVLVYTSDENDLLEINCLEAGANAFIRKQEDARILVAWCRYLITKD